MLRLSLSLAIVAVVLAPAEQAVAQRKRSPVIKSFNAPSKVISATPVQPQTPASAKAFVDGIYRQMTTNLVKFDDRKVRYAPHLLALLNQEQKEAGNEIGLIGAVIFCECQDSMPNFAFTSTVGAVVGNKTTVDVRLRNGSIQIFKVDVEWYNGGWAVADIHSPQMPSLFAYLQKNLQRPPIQSAKPAIKPFQGSAINKPTELPQKIMLTGKISRSGVSDTLITFEFLRDKQSIAGTSYYRLGSKYIEGKVSGTYENGICSIKTFSMKMTGQCDSTGFRGSYGKSGRFEFSKFEPRANPATDSAVITSSCPSGFNKTLDDGKGTITCVREYDKAGFTVVETCLRARDWQDMQCTKQEFGGGNFDYIEGDPIDEKPSARTPSKASSASTVMGAVRAYPEDFCDYAEKGSANASVEWTKDINADGHREVLVTEHGTYCYGNTGQGFWLVTQQPNKKWRVISRSRGILKFLPTKIGGWPEIEVGLPGFCYPILRWNGTEYIENRKAYNGKPCRAF